MTQIQDISNISSAVLDIVGVETYTKLDQTATISGKVTVIVDFLVDTYGVFFDKEETMEAVSSDLEILTSIEDEEYELTDEIVSSIMDLNQLVEDDDMVEEIKNEIKTLLVYLLDILS